MENAVWNPEDYARHSDGQMQWARELRSRLVLRGDEAILDVGCGDGRITADFASALPAGRVVGIDSSEEMIAYAARTYRDIPNLSFICQDARTFAVGQGFDVVFSNATLHWFADHRSFLHAAQRALRPDGRLMISCGGKGNAADMVRVFSELAESARWRSYFGDFRAPYFFYGTDDYEPWLREAGFAIDRLELVPKDMVHKDADGLAGWIRTTWMTLTDYIPEDQRDEFIHDIVRNYLKRFPPDAAGLTHVHMVRLEVEARREQP
jgi:trans-aconitate 2-methyltransferase